jgi:hypothetical protein
MASPKRTRRLSDSVQPERGSRSGRDRSHGLRRLLRPTTAYRTPRGAAIQRFGVRNVNVVTAVFAVVGKEVDARCRAACLHVALPDPSERRDRLGPCGRRAAAARADAHHRRPLRAPRARPSAVTRAPHRRGARPRRHLAYQAGSGAGAGTRKPRKPRVSQNAGSATRCFRAGSAGRCRMPPAGRSGPVDPTF